MTKATLDILIPHFNDASGLERSINSIEAQSWTGDLRIVLADDGSCKKEFARVEHLAKQASCPITLLRDSTNRGRAITRNRLLEQVEAPYVAWLDAGDLWMPNKLNIQFEHISRLRHLGGNLENIWVTCDYYWRWEGKWARSTLQDVNQDQVKGLLMGSNLRAYLWTILAPASSFKRIGRFDEELPRLQDLDYFMRFVRAGGQLVKPTSRDKDPLCIYEKSDIGRNAFEIRRCNSRIQAKHADVFHGYGKSFMRMRYYNAEMLSARYAINNRDIKAKVWFLLRAFMTHPSLALKSMAKKR